ncbi:SNF2 domain-containing protein CLASSY 1-like [Solanum dulcamara]|uniref:SNF2 domain-containing protein CLASSY 1-like n=1 Tax=Solanum dulcamara TaxID=45834 RepID=UPI002484DD98|nr:SNF2 domain-containing protein CLASSY 1-like [Solanum dulcamara]XP_055832896.1 SNF2 domain-containing protein CLASSY 1-like [Solanum dulcamara]
MKRHIHYNAHPIDPHPFEAFWYGSWQAVERLRINVGTITTHVLVNGEVIEENIPVTNLRMRSRKATLSDCACFLRPGLEVCVLSIPYQAEDSGDEKDVKPVWIDAKIRSIERKPHEITCTCKFHVSVYVTQGPPPILKKTLSKEINMLSIDQIAILQKLEPKPCEDKHYRWSSSDDCNSLQTFKLFIGKFSSDLTWLVTASVLKEATFDVRSIHNQIVYEIMDDDLVKKESNSDQHSYSVNFKLENGVSTTTVFQFSRDIPDINPTSDLSEAGPLVLYDLMGPRRSKRRFVQPERYYGCDDDLAEFDVEMTRLVGGRRKVEYEELPLALSIQADHAFRNGEIEEIARSYKRELFGGNIRPHEKKSSESSSGWRNTVKSDVNKLADKKSVTADSQHQLAIVPLHPPSGTDFIVHEQVPLDVDIPEHVSAEIGEIVSRYIYFNSSSTSHDRKASKMNFTKPEARRWGQVKISKLKFMGLDRRGGALGSHKKYKRNTSKKDSIYDIRSFKKGSVAANVYKELIRRCMANIDATLNKEQPPIIDQWKEFQSTKSSHRESAENLSMNKEEEVSEIDMLWKEMELALASCYLLDDSEDSHVQYASNVRIGAEIRGEVCRHDYRLNEEIGIICRLCGFVSTEIKDVPPPFMPSSNYSSSKEQRTDEATDHKQDDDGLDTLSIPASSSAPSSSGEGEENVWALIPDLGNKLRVHQKRAFEFLWKNIAGSIVPAEMQPESKERGGCVISHTPGAGKTLLIISFLVSYLKLFPGSRPLVLAPKTTLYTWYKEVLKWKIPVPVYQIHGGQTFKGEVLREKVKLCPGLPRNQDVMHVLDCLEKMQMWLSQPSVLLMGYTSFLTLTREDSPYAHRKYMAQVLRQCPGLLILDEGHNPRSTKSRLRKGLMKVNTRLRILLSGTLFQNNFGEYFNTLTLARPTFVDEVLKELDPKYKKKNKGASRFSLENRARKMFIDKISSVIDSDIPKKRKEGLNILKKLTGGFIDVHDGGTSDNLPGLQCYTLMMKSTTLQQEILVKLQNQRPIYKGFPLELELLITLGAIHPWLIRTTACSSQYFKEEELEALQKFKFDLKLGSKVKFVMSLVPRCLLRKEKVLIFCHNIAPINLFLEIFERFYGWRKGIEVLVLQGDIELFQRGRIMDQFEEPGGPSKVMLASITTCAEGISLTAASRVILLDSEWNPSKSKQAIARAFRPGQDKVVYVYQLLATGTLEEEKYKRTTWKEWVSSMIFSEDLVEDPSHWQAPKIEDELLREIVEEDRATLFHAIMKNEKASNMGSLQE